MRTAYVYVSDSNDIQGRYHANAVAALVKHVPSAHIFTLTAGSGRLRSQLLYETVVHVDDLFAQIYEASPDSRVGQHGWWPALVFARLLPPLMPQLAGFSRFVYMDNDTEVVSPHFSQVESLRLGDSHIAGSQETLREDVPGFCAGIKERTGQDIAPRDYRSSGVLIMDRDASSQVWAGLCRSAFDLECKHHFLLGDQDAINATFRLGEVSDIFNYVCPDPALVPGGVCLCHFAGPCKKHPYSQSIMAGGVTKTKREE